MKKNAVTPDRISSSTVAPFIFTVRTDLGCIILAISRFITFASRTIRMHLMPPAVEPAFPPMNISISRTHLLNMGHRVVSVVATPVVVIIALTW